MQLESFLEVAATSMYLQSGLSVHCKSHFTNVRMVDDFRGFSKRCPKLQIFFTLKRTCMGAGPTGLSISNVSPPLKLMELG